MLITLAITINGPNDMLSFGFFLFAISNIILIIAANMNDIMDIIAIFVIPKYNPIAPINFTSPSPIESFPNMNLLINVINKNIPPPASIPSNIFIVIAIFDHPDKNAIINPISNIVRFSLFGIVCVFKSIINTDNNIGVNIKYFINFI